MKRIQARKSILVFFTYALITPPSHAIGLATGPSLGIAGFRTSFSSTQPLQKPSMNNLALQMGWFAKLDLWLLYGKLDALFILDWHKLPNKLERNHFKSITLPLTIGLPIFSLFRPHIGLLFRLPLDDSDDARFKGNRLIESYREYINGYILGMGIDLDNILIDIYWEFARLSVARKAIDSTLKQGNKQYRPKQLIFRFSYNLLG